MKLSLLTACVFFLFVSCVQAQEITVFQFNGFGNLATGGLGAVETPRDASGASTVTINGIGGKYYTAENVAVRAALTLMRETASRLKSASQTSSSRPNQVIEG